MTTAYVTMLFVLLRFGMGRHVILATDPKGLTIVSIRPYYRHDYHLRLKGAYHRRSHLRRQHLLYQNVYPQSI